MRMATLVLVALLIAAGCENPRSEIDGELAFTISDAQWIAIDGSVVYVTLSQTVYSYDTTNPRRLRDTGDEAYGSVLACGGIGCVGFVVDESRSVGYLLDDDEVAAVNLPSAPVASYILEVANPAQHYVESMTLLPGGHLAVGRSEQDGTGAEIVVFDMSGPDPLIAAILPDPVTETSYAMVVANGRLFTHSTTYDIASESLVLSEVVVYDLANPLAPVEVARVPFDVPAGLYFPSIVVRGEEMFVVAPAPSSAEAPQSWIGRFRFSPDFTTLAPIGEIWRSTFSSNLALTDGYAMIGGPSETSMGFGTLVLRLDSSGGMVEERMIEPRGAVRRIAIDEVRGLVFVGGSAFQVLDLGYITTGEPSWP